MTAPEPDTAPTIPEGAGTGGRLLEIEHTYAEGTCLTGTRRADDLYRLLRSHGWLYRRSVSDFRLQASQDRPAKLGAIERTAAALRDRGFTVHVSIDQTARTVADAEADRAERAEHRAGRLHGRAERLQREAAARQAAADQVFDNIPFGQPLLTDSSGYAADRNRRERAQNNQSRAVELGQQARHTEQAAQTAAGHMATRHAPVTVANRIRELTAELRRLDRQTPDTASDATTDGDEAAEGGAGPVSVHAEQRAHVAAQLQHWRDVRDQQIRDGVATDYGRDDFQPGDLARMRGTLYVVVRVNRVSVTVPSPFGHDTGTIRFEHLTDRVRPGDARWPELSCLAVAQARVMAAPRPPHPAWQTLAERCRVYREHTTTDGRRCERSGTPAPDGADPGQPCPEGCPAAGTEPV